ncbi:putative integral membrane protein [Theileria parva strain Muguga]|uniref:putative integral membrane protein n=1 Tax=Theileria parva strain Muguga TaxID=333668 RepID=UPI001C617C99|nr:putative integral membrane protein [Theileria parva strain Muguga]KAF5153651.1 putative integral membrane protein [Theileria parva strain Muguga]
MENFSFDRIFNKISRILDSYIVPEYRLRIFIIYGTLLVLSIIRLILGRPFLEVGLKLCSRYSRCITFVRSSRSSTLRLIRTFYFIFSNVFPLLFPFIIASFVQLITPSFRDTEIYD